MGTWERRPLELATLRLQSMLGISIANWKAMAPDQQALDAGVLTQLGACLVVDAKGSALFEWKDPGICAVDRKSTRLNSSHRNTSRMPSSA